MEQNIQDLINKFNTIKNMGFVEAVNNDFSGIGLTFEKLLDKEVDNFPFPDYKNIEIKTKLSYSKTPINLFKLTPEGKEFCEVRRLWEKYGYCRKNNKDNKCFNGRVFFGKKQAIGLFYYFELKIDYKEAKIFLYVYNKNLKLIDNNSYWTFENMENALMRKLKYFALVKAWNTKKLSQNYYKYYRLDIYKMTNFYNFLKLIEEC